MPSFTLTPGGEGQDKSMMTLRRVLLELSEEWIGLSPGSERGLVERAQHGSLPELFENISCHISAMMYSGGMVVKGGGGYGALVTCGKPKL